MAATLERFHLAILLGEHRLCVGPPTDTNADAHTPRAHTHTYVRRHASNRNWRWHALPLLLAEHEHGRFVVLAQRVLSNWLALQTRWNR